MGKQEFDQQDPELSGEKLAKEQFQCALKKVFGKDANIVTNDKTTDVIYKRGVNEDDWLYFELKTTANIDKNDKNGNHIPNYFGAASLNQWIMATKYPNNYFFVLAYKESDSYKFCLVTPDVFKTYMTGYYMHVDFNIPFTFMREKCVDGAKLINNIKNALNTKESVTFPPKNDLPQQKKNKIAELDEIIASRIGQYKN